MKVLLTAMLLSQLSTTERVVSQNQGSWQIDYHVRYEGKSPLKVTPPEMNVKNKSWVSNSLVVSHGNPRRSDMEVVGASGPMATSEVIPSPDDTLRCRERIVLWVGNDLKNPPSIGSDPEPLSTLDVEPGKEFWVRIRLEHQHCLYGEYDPLLGVRELDIALGREVIHDKIDMKQAQYTAYPKDTWPEPENDHKDNTHFMSAPDSLLLEAGVPGNQYFRFPERKVRYSSRVKLEFWYRIAPGTEGEFKAKITQYRETPNAWKVLSDGGSEHTFKTVGRWAKFSKIFKLESEATTLALDFRIANADVGEVWIDDVTLTPLDAPTHQP